MFSVGIVVVPPRALEPWVCEKSLTEGQGPGKKTTGFDEERDGIMPRLVSGSVIVMGAKYWLVEAAVLFLRTRDSGSSLRGTLGQRQPVLELESRSGVRLPSHGQLEAQAGHGLCLRILLPHQPGWSYPRLCRSGTRPVLRTVVKKSYGLCQSRMTSASNSSVIGGGVSELLLAI